ncbi:hypothetical protein D3C73_798450 [compost metagenome]
MRPDVGQDQPRDGLVLIELAQEGGEDLRVAVRLVDAREVGAAAPVLARAIEEDLDAGLAALGMQGEDVGLGHAVGVDAVLHGDGRQGADAVAHPGGGLEVEVVGGRLHLLRQAGDDGARLAAQEGLGLVDQFAVVLQRDQAGARGRAALDLMQHAGAGAGLVDAVRAGPQQEGLLQGVQRVVDRPGRGEGAEIVAGHGVGAAMLAHLGRAVVAADHQFGEGLVVAQQDVEARLQLLDEVGFEQQGLGLGRRDHQLHRAGQRHHQADALGVETPLRVLDNPLLQRLGLADIEAGAVLAVHPIDAGLVGRAPGLVRDQFCSLKRKGGHLRDVGRRIGHQAGYRLSRAGPEAPRRSPAARRRCASG